MENCQCQKKHPRKHFTGEEDNKLMYLVESYKNTKIDWKEIAKKMKNRNSRQCKDRYDKYLNPNLRMQPWTSDEDETIKNLYLKNGPKWTLISNFLPNRTDIMVRNRWHMLHRKDLKKKKIDKNKDLLKQLEKMQKHKTDSKDDKNKKNQIDKNDEFYSFFQEISDDFDANETFMF